MFRTTVRMLRRAASLASVCLSAALALTWSAHAAQPPSATAYYERALEVMKALPEPTFMTYTENVSATGIGVGMYPSRVDGSAYLYIGWGPANKPAISWKTNYRAVNIEAITLPDGRHMLGHSPVYDPSWNGAYDWLRYGLHGPVPSSPTPSPHAAGASVATAAVPTIALVEALGSASYRIYEGGSATCSNGDPGHRLNLAAIGNADGHPLNYVVIDTRNVRFCTMGFHLPQESGLVALTGSFELHFGTVGSYWIITDGTGDLLMRSFGVSVHHAHLAFSFHDVAYPSMLSDPLFPPDSKEQS